MQNQLANKRVLITGGGTGIGFGIAQAFANEGALVTICGRRAPVLEQAVHALGANSSYEVLDVGDRSACQTVVENVIRRRNGIDILVNAAGVNIKNRSMQSMIPDQWDDLLRINLTGAYNLLYFVLPKMREQKDGIVFNISSVAGKRAIALGGIAYAASKFGMTALGTALSNEENANGIRITNIYPGEVDTPILEQRPTPVSAERRAAMLHPEDVAQLVLAIARLPARAHVPELVVKPISQEFV